MYSYVICAKFNLFWVLNCCFKVEDTRRDRKVCVEASRSAVTEHPSDGATKTYSQSALGGRVS
jgi:hypothetical protein